jgi:hypothetical protein
MHKFTSMYPIADGDQSTTRDDEGRADALLDILETTTTAPSSAVFASTAELTAAFYRHINAVAADPFAPMDKEEEDAQIDDDEY